MKTTIPIITFILVLVGNASLVFAQDNTQVGLPDGAIARLGKGGINIMQFSPDGSKLAVGTDVGVWLYDVPDGNATALFTDKPGQVNTLAFSDDGKILASGGHGNPTIQLWNLEDDTLHSNFILTSKSNYVKALVFQGQMLISYDGAGNVSHWNTDTGIISAELVKIPAFPAIFSQTGKILTATDSLGRIHIYDTITKEKYSILADVELKKELQCLSIAPNGKTIASGGRDNIIRLLEIDNDNKVSSLIGQTAGIISIAFSTDGKILASGDSNKEITLWDAVNTKKLRKLSGHKGTVNALAFTPDGAGKYSGCLASGSLDGTIRFWKPNTGEELVTFATGHTKWIKAIAFSENGSTLVSANMTGNVDVWSLNGCQEIATFADGECDYAASVAFTNDAKYFVCQGLNGYTVTFDSYGFGYKTRRSDNLEILPVQMWDITTGEEHYGPWNKTSGNLLAFSHDNKNLAIYGSKIMLVWNTETKDELFNTDTEKMFHIDEMVFSSDNKMIALYETSRNAKIWDLDKPDEPYIQTKHTTDALGFSPCGRFFATLKVGGFSYPKPGKIFIHILDMFPDGEPIEISANIHGFENRLIFSPDSKTIVWAGTLNMRSNVRIKLWDVETGEEIRTLSGHTEPIESLAFSHDGKILASGSFDGTVLLWDWEKISKRQEMVK